jgi:hypothetical protein
MQRRWENPDVRLHPVKRRWLGEMVGGMGRVWL